MREIKLGYWKYDRFGTFQSALDQTARDLDGIEQLARKTNVRYEAGTFTIDQALKNPRIGRMQTKMALQGEWENMRRFIYELETAAEFIIIDSISLAQGEVGKPQALNLELSTYYRNRANGS